MLSKNVRKALKHATTLSTKEFGVGESVSSVPFKVIQNTSTRFFYVAGLMCLLTFLLVFYLMITNRTNVAYLAAIQAIGGLSLAGLVTLMIRLAKAYTEARLVWILASKLPPDDILPTLTVIISSDKEQNKTSS